jgi:anthranilate synthase component 1
VVGYLDFSGNIDTAIAIRTMVIDPPSRQSTPPGEVRCRRVRASSPTRWPHDEELETRNKAKALLSPFRPPSE